MVEGVEELDSQDQRFPFLDLERALNTGVVVQLSWSNKGIAPNVAKMARLVDDDVVELIFRGCKRTRNGISAEGRVEVYKVHAVKAEADARIARTGWIQASGTVVDWNSDVSQIRSVARS